jgi:hypothetical protein
MLIDSKGKLFGKLSVIDILIILIILAGLAGAYYKFGKSGAVFTKTEDIKISFFAEDIPEYAAKNIKQGDIVKDKVSGSVIGKVTSVEVGPDIFYMQNDQGKMVKSSKEGYNSVKINLTGKGTFSSNAVTFGTADMYVAKNSEIYFGNTTFFAKVFSISR